ncbi:hypothetical protein K490DRAFT_31102 [Saccharata proteae CBS 121410]|uniref:DUF3074 domain-containing protein n=1 Tax=Saccharata proteae CBS 121410 TaxID=1314787 RepID=A0A9P4I4C7_9PEZI|nr:hypothetical protein K490DRAFT_31102 [Saccharata proteae CBS 121410]
MSALHEALKILRPKPWAEVPQDDLATFMRSTFAETELIVNSVPQPAGGTDFESATLSRKDANGARSASEMTVSPVRSPPVDPAHEELHKAWGKPQKFSQKDNPLEIAVFKMAGNDRHGAWFARKSVHEGLGFTKWKKAMQREFPESLAFKGSPGEGSIRGIGVDKRLEKKDVEGVGRCEVLQLAAQFPKPTAPREFHTLLLTSEHGLTEKSKPHLSSESEASKHIPRHFMVVSIPTEHPEAPPLNGYVLGQYESVEMIREIPIIPPKEGKGEHTDRKDPADEDDPERNPVEWIMITRSDPGGGIPRFMVDRGTPGSVVADTSKFLNWACKMEEVPDADADIDVQDQAQRKEADSNQDYDATKGNGHVAGVEMQPQSITNDHFYNGISAYAPESVSNYLNPADSPSSSSSSSSDDETSTLNSFASAEQYRTADDGTAAPAAATTTSRPATPDHPNALHSTESLTSVKSPKSHYEKELSKIDAKKAALDAKMAKTREKEASRTEALTAKEAREQRKSTEKYEKEMQKLAAKRDKEARKLEEKKRKERVRDEKTRLRGERDEARERARVVEEENRLLRERVVELQKENTVLVQRVGRTEGGREVLRGVEEDIMGRRSVSAGRKSLGARSRASTEVKTP